MTDKNITADNVPPNVRRLADYIQSKRNPEKVTAALLAYLGRGRRQWKILARRNINSTYQTC